MVKVRWLKDWKKRKKGDISNASIKSADNFVSQGYAEFVEEDKFLCKEMKEQLKEKEEILRTKKVQKDKTPNYREADKFARSLATNSLTTQMEGIEEGSKKYNVGKNFLKEIIKEEKELIKLEKEQKEKSHKEKITFSDKAKCKNCKFFDGECPYPRRRQEDGGGTCPEFTEGKNNFDDSDKKVEIINQTLRDILDLSPIEKKQRIERLSSENNIEEKLLREQLKSIEQEMKEKKKEAKEEYYKQKVLEEAHYDSIVADVLMFVAAKQEDEATELIVGEIKKHNHIYSTKDDVKSEMWIYDDGIYVPNGKCYVSEVCRKILGKAYRRTLRNEVIAKVEADTYINQDDFFSNNYEDEIPVKNGVLNVLTLELEKYNPKKIFFNKLPVEYREDAKCPNIEQFLKDILTSEEDIEVAYELVGSGLYKDYFTEKAAMLVGNGRNGKSKFLELIKRLVGGENCSSVPLRAMKEDNSSLCELYQKIFNLAGDLSHTDLKETGIFKQTVGRDTIQAHRKYLKDLHFVNFAKHIFACNELPRVYDTTDGFWDKWVLLQFPYKFESQKEIDRTPKEMRDKIKLKDPDIIKKISTEEELSGFLNKALEGLKRLIDKKQFSQTKGTTEIKDFWVRNSDSFAAFCIDCVEERYDSYITKKDLRKRYHRYCKGHKIKGTGDKSIKANLEERYGVIESRKRINDESEFVWEGIKFRSDL